MARALYDQYSFEPVDDGAHDQFFAGEPILPPPRARRGRSMLRAALMIACLAGGGYAYVQAPESWRTWAAARASEAVTQMSSVIERAMAQHASHTEAAAEALASPPAEHPVAEREIGDAPGAVAGTAVEPKTAALAPADVPADETANAADATPAPLPPPAADPADPYQKRALDAGLHPDLSQAVLSRFSDADFKNASMAITTALAETPDNGVMTWPKKAAAKRALFEVHFVRGAGADCRRYVVTVTLERWSTTAPAMEKCGAELPKRKLAKAAAG